MPQPPEPLVLEQGDRRLIVRLSPGGWNGGAALLLLEEERAFSVEVLAPLGLTQREAEVLLGVAQGKTDLTIARELGMRPRTVQEHLEHLYRKLEVDTRSAAAAREFAAWRAER